MKKRLLNSIPRSAVCNPMPELVDADLSGCFLIGNAESRLERFDNGWLITLAAGWDDGSTKLFCWKVYPNPATDVQAVEQVLRRARDLAIRKVSMLMIDKPLTKENPNES